MKNLTYLADKWGTDKGTLYEGHLYTKVYEKYLPSTLSPIMVEIGLKDPRFPGAGMKMWDEYFDNLQYYGFDIEETNSLNPNPNKFKLYQGDQSNPLDLINFINTYDLNDNVDVIIDDGSHVGSHIIITFKTLYPILKKGGIYIIEDLHAGHANRNSTIPKVVSVLINEFEFSDFKMDGKLIIITK